MVLQFNRKDLVAFGNYLLSEHRIEMFKATDEHILESKLDALPEDATEEEVLEVKNAPLGQPWQERIKEVHQADVDNFIYLKNKKVNENLLFMRVQGMCEQSLDPETFAKWEEVKEVLEKNRRLKEE